MNASDSSESEYTTGETSTSETSEDESRFEPVEACGVRVRLPEPLCRQKEIFDEFFSSHAWNSLTDNSRQRLTRLLPTFPEDDDHEKYVTLQRLLAGEVFRFSSPLMKFHRRLKANYYRPDIAKMRYMIRRAERNEAKQRYSRYRDNLRNEAIDSRKSLLSAISAGGGGETRTSLVSSSCVNSISYRTKVRYFQELATVKSKTDETGFSSDDNYPEGPPTPISRKQKRQLNSLRNSHPGVAVISTIAAKPCLDLEKHVVSNHNPFAINDESYKKLLLNYKRRKIEETPSYEFNLKGVSIGDVINRTKLTYVKKTPTAAAVKRRMEKKIKSRKKARKIPQAIPLRSPEIITKSNPFFGLSSHSEIESDSDSLLERNLFKLKQVSGKNQTPPPPPVQENHFKTLNSPEKASSPILNSIKSPFTPYGKIMPATFSDLDGIGMMNLPIDFEDDCIDILDTDRAELMQKTHTNFLSVIRDLICSTSEHRMDYTTLEERLKQWQENPISTLNDWYSSADNWIQLLKSAVDFLSGNTVELPPDFVPYIEYKSQLDMYQWIGAGRDSDASLSTLAKYWLDHRNEHKNIAIKEDKEEIEVSDRSQTPPPPRCPTNWSVRKAEAEEIRNYQEQERRRYDNPHKAFTFRCNGYESVVGPLKGIYSAGAGSSKARGHTMLSADRPNFVTILSLVRDATARLPNGEGTRADICELLKSSQYISPTAPDNVLQSVVSGALDRMHTQFDPCVKYDPKRKIWIYLHRNRSEEDFERIHQQYQNVGRSSKKSTKTKTPSKAKPRSEKLKAKDSPSPTQKIKSHSNTNSPEPGTSLLLPQINKLAKSETEGTRTPSPVAKISKQEEKEINDALQTIIQTQTLAVAPPKPKSIVKIVPTNHKSESPKLERPEPPPINKPQLKTPISVQQQILQTIGQSQQFKNVALIRKSSQPAAQANSVVRNVDGATTVQQVRVQAGAALTPTQQQQILQSLKQKVVPVSTSVLAGQQQVVVKQKGSVAVGQPQKGQSGAGTSLLNQNRVGTEVISGKSMVNSNQTPLVAKVLTNAAGHVISVESLLAHQKQHGSLPQGTTVRVSGMKGTPANIIQLSTPSKQLSVGGGSPNNIIAITNQPKLVFTSQAATGATTTAASKGVPKGAPRAQTVAKLSPKIAQQLINAKLTKAPSSSSASLGQNQSKPIRMVNAANLNLTHIGGKPVLLASKGNLQGHGNVVIQSTSPGVLNASNSAQYVIAPHQAIKVQGQAQQATAATAGQLVLGGQPVRLQSSGGGGGGTPTSNQRVVLAGQGQGGQIVAQQILLPAGFQGTAINIKALQNVKVIPIAQAQQAKGIQNKQVLARVMAPNAVRMVQATTEGELSTPTSD